jgi:hypothetical protein
VKQKLALVATGLVLVLAGLVLLVAGAVLIEPLIPRPDPCRTDTVVRAASQSGRVEALLDEINCGATTSFGYVVSLRPVASSMASGVRVASAYGAVRNEDAYGMNLVWVDENTLEIQYWKARWATLEHPDASVDGGTIATRMKADVRDETAPAGGMIYNRERRSAAGSGR